jgi:hypothetical protein
MIRFVLIFLVCIAVLFPLELLKPVDDYVIVPFTSLLADLCVWLIHLFDKGVVVEGKIVRSVSTGFAVSIERGCNGVEAVLILVSARFSSAMEKQAGRHFAWFSRDPAAERGAHHQPVLPRPMESGLV